MKWGNEGARRVATTNRGERRPRETQVRIIHPHARRRRDPLDPLEGIVRDPDCDEVGRRSEQAVAALDVGIEEAERSALLRRLHPEDDPQSSRAIALTSTP
jgi:hypothetical protein